MRNRDFFGRLLTRARKALGIKQNPASARASKSLRVEPLESRNLLSVVPPNAVWVNDNWVDQTNPGLSPPALGDTVTAPAGETVPNLGGTTLIYGQNAFSAIQAGVNAAASGGNVYVLPGTYTESDIDLNAPVSVVGPAAGSGAATVVPAVADSHQLDRSDDFGSGTHNAFVIASSDVSLSNLTIDGGAGYGYYGGVMTNWTTALTYNDLSVTNVTVEDTFGIGIYEDGGASPARET